MARVVNTIVPMVVKLITVVHLASMFWNSLTFLSRKVTSVISTK